MTVWNAVKKRMSQYDSTSDESSSEEEILSEEEDDEKEELTMPQRWHNMEDSESGSESESDETPMPRRSVRQVPRVDYREESSDSSESE